MVTKYDKSQNPISTDTDTVEKGIGKRVAESNKSLNPRVMKSDKHCTCKWENAGEISAIHR